MEVADSKVRKAAYVAGGGCLAALAGIPLLFGWHLWRTNASESLYGACLSGDEAAVRRWLRRGADPNFRFDGDALPIYEAVKRGDRSVVEALLRAGANPNLTYGCQPLSTITRDPKIRSLLERYRTVNEGGLPEDCRRSPQPRDRE